jgi:hypothetical protein
MIFDASICCASSSDKFEDTDISHWYQDAVAATSLAPCKRHILVGVCAFNGLLNVS